MILVDVLKAAVPERIANGVLLGIILLSLGWYASTVWAMVERHYTETTELVQISRHICKGIYQHAKLPVPKTCEVE